LKVLATLDEVRARWYVAQKAIELGHGGIQKVHELTGIARPTMTKGMRELRDPKGLRIAERRRRAGGGRKRREVLDPTLTRDLDRIMDETTRGDPLSLLRWSSTSTERMAAEMTQRGHPLRADTVRRLLQQLEYSLQATVKVKEGERQPDRDGQFRSSNEQVKASIAPGEPVMSVDTKKQERVGAFKHSGPTGRKRGQRRAVLVDALPHWGVGTAIPDGTDDVQPNPGVVHVGRTHDTAECAVESLRRGWHQLGCQHDPRAQRMLICADGGGSHGRRSRGWKFCVQQGVDEVGFPVTICHDPPGTRQWHNIEHRMFSCISVNWRGEPLVSYETVIHLISTTTTKTGLQVKALLDTRSSECGMKISDAQRRELQLTPHAIHPQWNYTISPRRPAKHRASPKK